MRLTLRTMLAYLDNILEQDDAETLGAKISESEFASDLVYRTLSSTRKANLSAPPLDGKGVGADPNTVAEYLDNTLSESRIPGFEKVCLESDMYLSEVACCHSILSNCMDQPVAIKNDTRDHIVSAVQQSITQAEQLEQLEETRPALENLIQPKPAGVPEYINTKAHPLWRATVILTFLLLMAIIGLRAVGPFDTTHPWVGSFFEDSIDQSDVQPVPTPLEDPESDSTADLSQQSAIDLQTSQDSSLQPTPTTDDFDVMDSQSPETQVLPNNTGVSMLSDGGAFGELLSDSQPLLRAEDGALNRLVSGAQVLVGDALVSIPEFRPELLLNDGTKLLLADASGLETSLLQEDTLNLYLAHGKLVIQGGELITYKYRLQAGDVEFDVVLNNPQAVVALESVPYQTAEGEVSRLVRLVVNHHVTVSDLSSQADLPAALDASLTSYVVFTGNSVVTRETHLPEWATDGPSDSIMSEAQAAFIESIVEGDDFVQQLQRIYESHRLVNVRRLAAYSLMELGDAIALLGVLNDQAYRAYWHQDIKVLQAFCHRDVKSRALVESALMSYSSDNTQQLLSFLTEYSDEQLLSGVADDMIDQLESQIMVERVISFYRLQQITGKTLLYKPQENPQRQTLPIREWRELLTDNMVINRDVELAARLLSK